MQIKIAFKAVFAAQPGKIQSNNTFSALKNHKADTISRQKLSPLEIYRTAERGVAGRNHISDFSFPACRRDRRDGCCAQIPVQSADCSSEHGTPELLAI